MKAYPECFGKQSPYTICLGDGSKIVVWASSDEFLSLESIEELGQKCLFCKNDYLCFEASRLRDFCLGRSIRLT